MRHVFAAFIKSCVRISLFSKIIRFIGRLVMTFSLSLNSETPGLNRALAAASKTVEISMERLASGKKITRRRMMLQVLPFPRE
jgi:hypothetical protein